MDKNQTEILISEKINNNIIDLKNDKSNSYNELNNIMIIKELISSLKEKINTYEKQIKKLIDDKVKLQMDMNSIILQNLSLKKKNNPTQNIENSKEEDILNINSLKINSSPNNNSNKNNNQDKSILSTLIEINKKLLEQNNELKSQIDIYKSNIDIYKQKLSKFKENYNEKDTKCKFCEEKKLELNRMASEKEEIFNSIKSLRKQLDELKLNEQLKKEKRKKQKIGKNESLVDSNKDLWHMKKCMKFQEFKKKFDKANLSPDDLLREFVETYEIKIDEESNEENEYIEGQYSSERRKENERKKHENKYMPPLPGMSSSNKKKIENNNNNDMINNEGSEINANNTNINSEDIQININENDYDKKDKENKEIKNEEKKEENNSNNINEIKEETSFNLSDNTD